MKKLFTVLFKILAAFALFWVLKFSFQDAEVVKDEVVDLRAALLVFIAPVLIFIIFQTDRIRWVFLLSRAIQVFRLNNDELLSWLEKNTTEARGLYGYSHVVKMSQSHFDRTVRYAGEAFSARFSPEELQRLLSQRLQEEDSQWQSAYSLFGFLAKMAPYFGMMATVVGMVKLLEKLSDLAMISSNMSLAMQGTLYGLVSLLIVYNPMQTFFQTLRAKIFKRNELISEWFLLVAQEADPSYIKKELMDRLNFSKSSARDRK